jgi:uncharacterized membrane protein
MLRKIIGFAVLAIVAIIALNLAFGLLKFLWGATKFVLTLALVGVVVYWVLKLIAPSTARRVREAISGEPRSPDV